MNRTDRQDQIPGWDGRALEDESVGVIGSGPLAEFVISYCAGLGTKKLVLVDNEFGKGYFLSNDQGPRIYSIEDKIKDPVEGLNPEINVVSYNALPMDFLFKDCSVIVDLTNKKHIKETSYNISKSLPSCRTYVSASTDTYHAGVIVKNTRSHYGQNLEDIIKSFRRKTARERILKQVLPNIKEENHLLSSYHGKEQGIVTSSIAASIVVEEIRRTLVPLENLGDSFSVVDRNFTYNLPGKDHCDSRKNIPLNFKSLRKKNVLIIGAGGTGTYASLNLALLGVNAMTIADPDIVSISNLNRQMLYSISDVGHNKSKTISKKLRLINPRVKISSYPKAVSNDSAIRFKDFDCIYLCVDSAKSRFDVSNLSVKYSLPVINAGVSPFRANVEMYIPGKTTCLNCQNGNYSGREEERRTVSCADVGDPSIVVTNALAGSLMVAESIPILCGADLDYDKQFYYSSFRHDDYLKVIKPRKTINSDCGCRRLKNEAA